MPSSTFTVAIIAKPCLPGRVKTRLTPPFSPEQAAVLAEASLRRTVETVRAIPGAKPMLFFDGDVLPDWAWGFSLLRQPEGELDERLGYLFDHVSGPLLMIGMDTPQVNADLLARALNDANHHDAWIGLAPDGGFWALGMREPDGSLIRGVAMSQADTGLVQHERVQRAFGSKLGSLPQLEDFDDRASALRVADLIPNSTFATLVRTYLKR